MNTTETKDSESYCDFCKRETEIKTDYVEGTRVCQSCGLVLERNLIDTTAEYRIFSEGNSSGSDPRRVGGIYNYRLADGGLALDIDGGKNDEFSKTMKKLNMRLNDPEDRSLYKANSTIKKWCEALALNNQIVNKAEELFYTLDKEKKSFKGRSVDSLASAVLWIACRQCNCPLKPQQLSDVTNIPIKEMAKSYHLVKKYFPCFSSVDAVTYCENFANTLGMSENMRALALNLTSKILEKRLVEGRNPRTIAATALYIISMLSKDERKTLKEISNASDIAENTIKTCYRELYDYRTEIVPKAEGMLPVETLSK